MYISWPNITDGRKLSHDIGRKRFNNWFIKYYYGCVFSICFKLSIFLPVNPA